MTRLLGIALSVLLLAVPRWGFAQAPPPPPAPCVCTPLVMNTDSAGSQTWFFKAGASGGVTVTAVAHAVNSSDPETLQAQILDASGATVATIVTGYAAGAPNGFESAASALVAGPPNAVYRAIVSTPATPPEQSHYRLRFDGALSAAISSPSPASFEEEPVRWRLAVNPAESLTVRLFMAGVPITPGLPAATLVYRLIDPGGVARPFTMVSAPLPGGFDTMINVAGAAAGQWTLEVVQSDTHYRLDKTTGIDRSLYVDWRSSVGGGAITGNLTLNGAPNTAPVTVEIIDQANGLVVRTLAGVTSSFRAEAKDAPLLFSGSYAIRVVAPPSVIAPLPPVVQLTCSTGVALTIALQTAPPPPSQPPVIETPVNGQSYAVRAGQMLSIPVRATDPDAGGIVTLGASGLPPGATFGSGGPANPATGALTWTPTPSDVGSRTVMFTAVDNAGMPAPAVSVVITVTDRPPFTGTFEAGPSDACICTPLVMNSDSAGTQTWYFQAGPSGTVTVAAIAHAVNNADPETVRADVFDDTGAPLGSIVTGYPAGSPNGFESSASGAVAGSPGAVYRVVVSTPATPPTQSHYRLKFDGAVAAATPSPSSPSFEEEPVRWRFAVNASEDLDIRLFMTGVPTNPALPAATLKYRLIEPSGAAWADAVITAPLPAGFDTVVHVAGAATGVWTIEIIESDTHYRLSKTTGSDRGIYLDWRSTVSHGAITGVLSLNGVPNTTPVTVEIVDQSTGIVVRTIPGVTDTFSAGGLLSGYYEVRVLGPPDIAVPAPVVVVLTCDSGTPVALALRSLLTISVSMPGSGAGTITSDPPGLSCADGSCTGVFPFGGSVTLIATPNASSSFAGWSGACTGTGTCTLTIDAPLTLTATFTRTFSLTVNRIGAGLVTSNPVKIFCGSSCTASFDSGTVVTLSAMPEAGSIFTGWSGACTGTGACSVTMDAAQSVTATFVLETFPLTVTLTGTGAGTVTSTPDGIDCGASCTTSFDSGTLVMLTATPATGSMFGGWSGPCSGTLICTVTMAEARTVTATFTRRTYDLTIGPLGTGGGRVTSAPEGINCGATGGSCTGTFDFGTQVMLTATPAAGSVFGGWGGACAHYLTLPTCTFPIDGPQDISAIFNREPVFLAVNVLGTGTGTVESSPAGIACSVGLGCSHSFDYGTTVTLTADPEPGTAFSGWSGPGLPLACSVGTPETCSITLKDAQLVNATFAALEYLVTVRNGYGNGQGFISSSDGWLAADSCTSPSCRRTYPWGAFLDLTATPADPQSSLAYWIVNGTNVGTVLDLDLMFKDLEIEVWWDASYWLSVTRAGTGSGTVTDSAGAVNCGSDCLGSGYDAGDVVILTATPAPGSIFAGWSSAPVVCTGTVSPCEFVWGKRNQEVTATFTALPELSITKAVSLTEGDTGTKIAQFVVSIPTPATVDITFDYATADVTATDGSDYNGGSGTGVIPAGFTNYSINVQVYGDLLVEPDETFTLTISNSNAPLGNTVGTATIINDDDYPTVSFATNLIGSTDRSTLEGSTGAYSTHVPLEVVLSAEYPRPVSVTYNTADITATAGADYIHAAGTLTFNPGETAKTIFIDVNAEYFVESDEDLRANLITASNATIAGGAAVVTIINDDLLMHPFSVVTDGNGSGSVAKDGAGCTAGECEDGKPVTLTAVPAAGSIFGGWGGACAGQIGAACTLVVTGATTVRATFNLIDLAPPMISGPAAEELTREATGLTTQVMFTQPTAIDAVDGPVPVVCAPASGTLFALGATEVTCAATDRSGNTAATVFVVTVIDTTPPVVIMDDVTVRATDPGGIAVHFVATATDNIDGMLEPVCSPTSGSILAIGTHGITCSATDASGNATTIMGTATVGDGVPPTVTVPVPATVEATEPAGRVWNYLVEVTDNVPAEITPSCSPVSGSVFPIGLTTVTCTAIDADGNIGSGQFAVTVEDTTPPLLNVTEVTAVAVSGSSSVVDYPIPSVTDIVSGALTPTCDPAPGSTFPVGRSTVVCAATDEAGNTGSASFLVIVTDGVPPTVTVPTAATVEATGPDGRTWTFQVEVTDNVDPSIAATCVPASGSVFALGATTVTCSATDALGNTGTASFIVTVVDTTPPALSLPAPLTASATSTGGAVVTFSTAADDLVDGMRAVTCIPAAGSTFAVGSTQVVCTSSDTRDNTSTGTFMVTVTPYNGVGRFVVFSVEQTRLRANATVASGDVGANEALPGQPPADGELEDARIEVQIGERVQMLEAGSRVVGDTVRLRAGASVHDVHYNDLINHGTVLGVQTTPIDLPFLMLPAFPVVTPGTSEVRVVRRSTLTLAAGAYGRVVVEQGATLVLSGGLYQLQSLELAQQASVQFRAASEVRVATELHTAAKAKLILDQSIAGLRASDVVFYVAGDNSTGGGPEAGEDGVDWGAAVVRIGEQNVVQANIYAAHGAVRVKGKTHLTGALIGVRVDVGSRTKLTRDSAFR